MTRVVKVAACLIALLVPVDSVLAQSGIITGQVVEQGTNRPLPGAQVYLEGTGIGALSTAEGRYRIANVPPGTYTVLAQVIGYAVGRRENLRVFANQTATVNFELSTSALKLREVVVTGTVDPVAGVKVPFTVGKVTKEDLPIPAASAAQAIQGKIAGARVVKGSGTPGTGGDILLRGAKSLTKTNSPLIVVDGVILGATMSDIDASDIESVEVVKGAAASSLYGSRAANGVIQISTSRGRDVQENSTRISVSSEMGLNELVRKRDYITKHHHYLVDPAKGYVDRNGNPVDKARRVADPNMIADNPYPGPLYDQIGLFFDPGRYTRSSVSIGQNTRSTNFNASFNLQDDAGVVPGNEGAQLYGLRVNLDHRLRSDLNFSVSSYYSRFHRDEFGSDVFYDLMFMPPDVDLKTPNPDGQPYIVQPDPFTLQENPLYAVKFRDDYTQRSRMMGSTVLRYSPVNWFSVEGNLSFDRSDRHGNAFQPKGFKTLTSVSTGSISRSNATTQALNGGITASALRTFGELTVRTKGQVLAERQTEDSRSAGGNTLAVIGVPDVDVAINESASSNLTEIRSLGFYVINGLDYRGKYIAEGLVRRDGSSLFGPENRWNTYYRASAAWRMAEEPWWPVEQLNEFKLRYSIGTAGNRPGFSDRFETWSVSGAGAVSKGTLGNRALKPERSTEQEFGVDLIAFDRLSLQLTYATSKIEDQLLQIPLPGFYGYGQQWQNAGTIEGHTYEATLEATLLQRSNMQWSIGVVADRSRSEITEFNRGCYRWGSNAFYYCEGVKIGTIWAQRFLRSPDELPQRHASSKDQFAVNDDGLLVAVGPGNTFKDGLAKNLWGTRVTIDGTAYDWGMPIIQRDSTNNPGLYEIGDGNPKANLGFSSNFRWKGVGLYGLVDVKVGGDVYNNTRQWAYRDYTHADYDQSGKPDELKKTVTYYQRLYNTNTTNSWFVENGGFVKLRELSATYSFTGAQLNRIIGGLGVDRVTVGVVGRNLLTFTGYSGFDPEVGEVLFPYDGFDYPNFRNYTLKFDVVF